MKKRTRRGFWTLIIFLSLIAMAFVVFICVNQLTDPFNAILGGSSVMVTLFLGLITYYQTKEQTQIDMIDKTPYFRIVKDTEYEHHATPSDIDTNTEYQYKKFLCYSYYGENIGSVVTLELENISDCIIKKVKKYVCNGKKYSCGGKFVRYQDSNLVKLCGHRDAPGYEFHNNFNLHEQEFDLIPNDRFALSLIIGDAAALEFDKSYDFSVALEIETVHGYVYTQRMEFTVTPVKVYTAADWVSITDYDVDIVSERMKKKYLA